MSFSLHSHAPFLLLLYSFDATAEVKCGEYCQKALDSCPSNPEAYQLMASYLLSKGNVKVTAVIFVCVNVIYSFL